MKMWKKGKVGGRQWISQRIKRKWLAELMQSGYISYRWKNKLLEKYNYE